MSYFGNCRNWNELRACFEHSKYKPPTEPLNVLFSYIWEAEYEGNIFVLFQQHDKLYLVDSGWCSCGEPEWKPEETSAATLRIFLEQGTYFHRKIFEYYGYDIGNTIPYGDFELWNSLKYADIPVNVFAYLDNLLTELGSPPDENGMAMITGDRQTISEIPHVFSGAKISTLLAGDVHVLRAKDEVINRIRDLCPEVYILTLREAIQKS